MHHDLGTVEGLKDRCDLFRTELESGTGVSEAELRASWPGGSSNEGEDLAAWIVCYADYRVLLDRMERPAAAAAPTNNTAALETARRAILEQPYAVDLDGLDADGNPRSVLVYPKSYHAITIIDQLSRESQICLDLAHQLETIGSAEAVLRRNALMAEQATLHQTMAWIACAPPRGDDGDLPFDTYPKFPDPPARFQSLNPVEILLIQQAYRTRNAEVLAASVSLLRRTDGGEAGPTGWETLAARAAKASGQAIEHLLRNRSLGAWVTEFILNARADQAAASEREAA